MKEQFPVITGFGYEWMKLFHLSVLWRFGAAEGFGGIDLGPYAECVRRRLLSEHAGPVQKFPVSGCLLLDKGNHIVDKLITVPGEASCGDSRLYVSAYAGCEWLFLMTKTPTRKQQEVFDAFGLRQDGSIRLMTAEYTDSRPYKMLVHEARRHQGR